MGGRAGCQSQPLRRSFSLRNLPNPTSLGERARPSTRWRQGRRPRPRGSPLHMPTDPPATELTGSSGTLSLPSGGTGRVNKELEIGPSPLPGPRAPLGDVRHRLVVLMLRPSVILGKAGPSFLLSDMTFPCNAKDGLGEPADTHPAGLALHAIHRPDEAARQRPRGVVDGGGMSLILFGPNRPGSCS